MNVSHTSQKCYCIYGVIYFTVGLYELVKYFSRKFGVVMPLKLMYITNNPTVATIAEKYGVDRIWVDLESIGKEERQHGMNTVKSNHTLEDVSAIRNVIRSSQLLVRVNPLYEETKKEVDEVIERGADLIMLPMFRTVDDAKKFVEIVGGRAKTILLVETIEAERCLKEIVKVPGADEIHIGLNDLHLAYKMRFMFELLAEGKVDAMCSIIRKAGIPYGFGGIARLNEGTLPARAIIAEHYRLGSSMVILSRSFYDSRFDRDDEEIELIFKEGIAEIREYEEKLLSEPAGYFEQNHQFVQAAVSNIVKGLNKQ